MRNKQVIHVGFGGHPNDLRGKCRHRIDLGRDRLFRRMQRGAGAESDKPAAPSTRPPPSGPRARGSNAPA
jgi:hypothetical protein